MRRMHVLLTGFLLTALVATSVSAVAPQFWRVRTAEDFLAGELEGFAVTSRGELRAAPSMKKIATFTDPFVLSQATAPNGDRFFGTGNDGKVYRLRGTDAKLLWTAPEPEVYAAAFHGGALYIGTSPNGKVYRVDPESGKQTVFYDPQQAYIWALEFVGDDLAVATGVDGKLFRVTPKGEGKVWFDSTDTHLRSLAARGNGLLVGASGKGRIYSVAADGSAHALYESPLNEITAVLVDANGIGWAAAVSNVLPAAAPAKTATGKGAQQQGSGGAGGSADAKKEEATPTVEVSVSFDDASAASSSAQAGSSELYRIDHDDFVETARKFEREMIYGLSAGSDGSVLLATGPNGRIYEVRGSDLALLGAVPEKQVVSISRSGTTTLVTTTNSGAVYQMDARPSAHPEFRSVAKDVERFSRFGNYRVEGRNLTDGTIAIAFRTGNTKTPDSTWSAWSTPQTTTEGNITSPAGRYVQYKVTMPKSAPDATVENVSVAFINRNVAPEIDAVSVQEPAVVFVSSAYPSSPQVLEATNPDEYGIFTSLDAPRDRSQPDQGKRMFRKGYRTVAWRAHDDNGDSLRYALGFRPKGNGNWLRLRENVEESQLNFDTSQLPDGRYELRLVASDAEDNPDGALTDMRDGVEFVVDNTSPTIAVSSSGDSVTVRITDTGSPVGKVEYSADAKEWIRLTPIDGIADSRDETFKLKRTDVSGKFVVVRAVDGSYNVATATVP
jgi:hypothetical protein